MTGFVATVMVFRRYYKKDQHGQYHAHYTHEFVTPPVAVQSRECNSIRFIVLQGTLSYVNDMPFSNIADKDLFSNADPNAIITSDFKLR